MDGFGLAKGGDAGGRPGWDGDNRLALGDLVISGLAVRALDIGSGDGAGDEVLLFFAASSWSQEGEGDMMRSSAEDAPPVAVDRTPPLAVRSILARSALSTALRNIDSPAV